MKLTAEDYYKKYFSENYELIKNDKGKPFFRFDTMIEFAEMYSRKQLLIHGVVKSSYCDCKKHSIKTNYGFEVCTKCGNESDD